MPKVLGISFADGSAQQLVNQALKGGLIVVPSGPGLATDLLRSAEYRKAVTSADIAVADSGAMVLFMKLFHRKRIRRVSGLHFLEELLAHKEIRVSGSTFWVHPSPEQMDRNSSWLEQEEGFQLMKEDHYVAPLYPKDSINDQALIQQLLEREPKVVVLCIGGGVQERLGHWIREQYRVLNKRCPAIVCTGAAIGFLSGNQVNIPRWADRLYLGWFFRCLYEPRKFVPRYWKALPLAYLVAKYGDRLPPMRG